MKRNLPIFLFAITLALVGAGCTSAPVNTEPTGDSTQSQDEPKDTMQWSYQGKLPDEQIQNKQIRITTEKGDIVVKLFDDVAPLTVSNMIYLASNGFYDGLTFHRITHLDPSTPSKIVQGGDPLGNGTGGPGYTVPAEISAKHVTGSIATARTGDQVNPKRNSSGSQFYIVVGDVSFLDDQYTVFGQVTEGLSIADSLMQGDVMTKVTVEDVK